MNYNNYETEEIWTERLVLKRGTLDDFLKVYEYDFKKLLDVEGECKLVKKDNTDIKKSFKLGKKHYYDKCKKAHMFDWIIYLNDEPVGNIFTEDENDAINGVILAYNLHPTYWGKGYMPEALESALNYLFKVGYDNIICGYLDGNKRSRRVLEKLNFKPYKISEDVIKSNSGNLVDSYNLIMNKEDWLSRTSRLQIIKLGK